MAGQGDFRQVEDALFADCAARLEEEHNREVQLVYDEQLELRDELSRIVELMQKDILPRERHMHDLIENMHNAYEAATQHMHEKMAEHVQKGGLSQDAQAQRQSMQDPMKSMEDELKRIGQLLSHAPVAPDIQGWQSSQTARQKPFSPTASSPGRRPAAGTQMQSGRPTTPSKFAPPQSPTTQSNFSPSQSSRRPQGLPGQLFSCIDSNKDGVIDQREWLRAFSS